MVTTPYRVAFLTDIHANLHALEAVLSDIRRAAPDLVIVGGDLTFKFPYPRETLELLATVEHQAIAGNTERYVTAWTAPDAWPTFLPEWGRQHALWTREQIGEEWVRTLAALPEQLSFSVSGGVGGPGDVLIVHGVPGNPFIGVHHPPGPENLHPAWAMDDEALANHLERVRVPLLLCGHTHIPLVRRWRGSLIVNPGAVAHGWLSSLDPHLARYALLTYRPSHGWSVDMRAVPYDNAAAVEGLLRLDTRNAKAGKLADIIRTPAAS